MPHYGSGEDPPVLHKLHFHLTLTLKMEAACFLKDEQNSPILHGPRPKNMINGNSWCYHNKKKKTILHFQEQVYCNHWLEFHYFPVGEIHDTVPCIIPLQYWEQFYNYKIYKYTDIYIYIYICVCNTHYIYTTYTHIQWNLYPLSLKRLRRGRGYRYKCAE
jgi:hypothetical protein